MRTDLERPERAAGLFARRAALACGLPFVIPFADLDRQVLSAARPSGDLDASPITPFDIDPDILQLVTLLGPTREACDVGLRLVPFSLLVRVSLDVERLR